MVVLRSLPDDLPASAVAVREYVARLGIPSYLGIPLRVGGQSMGAIGFGAPGLDRRSAERAKVLRSIWSNEVREWIDDIC